jgi:nitronate monooxygenase
MVILPLIISAISSEINPPIVAAGGVATGAQIASLLTIGASGVALGTRFLLSPESLYSDIQRRALISAESSLSVRTLAFDCVRDTLGWPKGIDGRALRNGFFLSFSEQPGFD